MCIYFELIFVQKTFSEIFINNMLTILIHLIYKNSILMLLLLVILP